MVRNLKPFDMTYRNYANMYRKHIHRDPDSKWIKLWYYAVPTRYRQEKHFGKLERIRYPCGSRQAGWSVVQYFNDMVIVCVTLSGHHYYKERKYAKFLFGLDIVPKNIYK